MLQSKFGRSFVGVVVGASMACAFLACDGGGDTDGNPDSVGVGDQFVDNGGAGSTLRITANGPIPVGGRIDFLVTATDPSGLPLSNIRLNCESEHGIAIIEPSRGGVAFEHTNVNGIMSGVLGGVAPGSYLLECRGPQGFNLQDRISLLVTGDVPEGFDGFPGAAGGNLGGGTIVEVPDEDLTVRQVQIVTVSGEPARNGIVDISFNGDCDGDPTTVDPEDYGFDNFQMTITNQRDDRAFVNSVTISIPSLGISATQQLGGLVIPDNAEVDLVGTFTEFPAGSSVKVIAGSGGPAVPTGTYNVTFTVRGSTGSGDSFTLQQNAAVTFGAVDNCG
ncbi:MAG: hypothetical protein KDD69_13510 [Bdellovibrionales bacterium]|nr:hypothetical protein [Bdellovibrionales bacterium]